MELKSLSKIQESNKIVIACSSLEASKTIKILEEGK